MKKLPLFFLLFLVVCAFAFKIHFLNSSLVPTGTWSPLPNLPYTLSHNVTVATDTASNKILIMGGIANDTITSRVLLYNTATATYTDTIPKLPKKLMNGFGFRLRDSIYYGGGYTTNWDEFTPTADSIFSGYAGTSGICYATGQQGKVYLTKNSWATSTIKRIPDNTKNVIAMSMLNNLTGYFLTNKPDSIYFTSDSCSSWKAKKINFTYKDIFFINPSKGWLCGNSGKIAKTVDSGSHWQDSITLSGNLNSICFIDTNKGYVCGSNGKIFISTNSGLNWTTQTTNVTVNLNSIIAEGTNAYCCGDSGVVLTTTNSGSTWNRQKSFTVLNLKSISKASSSKLLICGERGAILYSTNSGAEWINRVGVTGSNLNKVCISPSDTIPFVIGSVNKIIKANRPFFEYAFNTAVYKKNINSLFSRWDTTTASIPSPIAEVFSSSVSVGDKFAYIIGGRKTGFQYSDSVLRYNSLTNSWLNINALPKKLSECAAAMVDTNTLLIMGGKNSSGLNGKVYKGTINAAGIITWDSLNVQSYPYSAMGSKGFPARKAAFFIGGNTEAFSFFDAAAGTSSKVFYYSLSRNLISEVTLDAVNPVSHTGIDGFISNLPSENFALDSSVRIFAPGGRDSNYLPLNTHKVLKTFITVSVIQLQSLLPNKYSLSQNYPNPFNPETKIIFELPKKGLVTFEVFDITGRAVFEKQNEYNPGRYEMSFNAQGLTSGIYFYRLSSGSFVESRKMILIK
ncbi:MAG: T9SS type A sorting domain-containing protein [Ignavibacteria bacterium]|nr:T9SS type A sorting domain-containing protein [Ignavibacteria bacterium]